MKFTLTFLRNGSKMTFVWMHGELIKRYGGRIAGPWKASEPESLEAFERDIRKQFMIGQSWSCVAAGGMQ